jgi:hypothetical protein
VPHYQWHAGVIAASIPAAVLILWLYRDQLLGPIPDYAKVLSTVSEYRVTDWDLMAKSGGCGHTCSSPWMDGYDCVHVGEPPDQQLKRLAVAAA